MIWHQRRQGGSPTWGLTIRPGVPWQVITHYKGSTARETEPCQYCHCLPSTSKFPKSSLGNGTTTAQMPKVNSLQQIICIWLCAISPGAATAQVQWVSECPTTQGQWRSECSPTPKGNFWGSKKIHGCNRIHKDSLPIYPGDMYSMVEEAWELANQAQNCQ